MISFLQNFLPSTAEADMPSGSPDYQPQSSAVCRKLPQNVLTPAQREAAIRRALSLAVKCEATAKHARQLVAQLKELSDEQA